MSGSSSQEALMEPSSGNAHSPNTAKSVDAPRIVVHQVTTAEQVHLLKDLALEFHNESRFSHISFSEEKFLRTYLGALEEKNNIAFYITLDDKPVGIIGAKVGDYFLGEGGRMATTYIVYVSQSVRKTLLGGKIGVRLIRLLVDWSKAQECQEIHIIATAGIEPEHTDAFVRRLGFEPYGGNYVVGL